MAQVRARFDSGILYNQAGLCVAVDIGSSEHLDTSGITRAYADSCGVCEIYSSSAQDSSADTDQSSSSHSRRTS